MITDALVNFVNVNSPLAILGANVRSAVYDILGSGTGTAPANIFGTATLFGEDTGIPTIWCITTKDVVAPWGHSVYCPLT